MGTDLDRKLLKSGLGAFGYVFVDELSPAECSELLEAAKADGWKFLTRSVSWCPKPKDEVEPQELWYFERAES